MPGSSSLHSDAMQNMVSRSFLLSLWWKELTCLAAVLWLIMIIAARLALRGGSQSAESAPSPSLGRKVDQVTD